MNNLTEIDHIAIESKNIKISVDWYKSKFKCKILYQDKTWALLSFKNISLALVNPKEHPSHFAIVDKNICNNPNSKSHRDGIKFIYETDPDKNVIERIDRKSN